MDGAKRLSGEARVAEPNFQRMERATFSVVMGTIMAHWIMGSFGNTILGWILGQNLLHIREERDGRQEVLFKAAMLT